MFRKLYADEIEVRIHKITEKGAILLLYKDARVDQEILDETVGPMNWTRSHLNNNANCVVSIWDQEKNQWISKEDTGTESFAEKEKGLASDSFKRACFNWGIGRELYTKIFIWVPAEKIDIKQKNGKCSTFDKFKVEKITYAGNKIDGLSIINQKGARVFVQQPKVKE